MHYRLIAVPWYGWAALTGIAAAQPPALTYDSPYAAYQPYCDERPASWREANDEVARATRHAASGTSERRGDLTPADASRESPPPPVKAPAAAHGHH